MSEIRWEVYSDLIPLTGRPVPIGEVLAPDKPTALTRAAAIHGGRIVVQSLASRKCAARELAIPTTLKTKREEMEERRAKALADAQREVDRNRRRHAQIAANHRRKQKLEPPIGARDGDFPRVKAATKSVTPRDAQPLTPLDPSPTPEA